MENHSNYGGEVKEYIELTNFVVMLVYLDNNKRSDIEGIDKFVSIMKIDKLGVKVLKIHTRNTMYVFLIKKPES